MKKYLILTLLMIAACAEPPTDATHNPVDKPTRGALILCEGLWHYENSRIDLYNFENNEYYEDYYDAANNGRPLGDVANHIVLLGDTALIAMTSSNIIEAVDVRSGLSIARLEFAENLAPRHIAIVSDSSAWFSSLFKHAIYEFDPRSLRLTGRRIQTGPAPEDIIYINGKIFTANSGYGDYLYDREGAGTISVIDPIAGVETDRLWCGPNPMRLAAAPDGRHLVAAYFNLPSRPDSAGGVVIYNIRTLERVDSARLMLTPLSRIAVDSEYIYCITRSGIMQFLISNSKLNGKLIIQNPDTSEFWLALAASPDGRIWTGNARNYHIGGEIRIYSSYGNLLHTLQTGMNPSSIIFF